MMAGIDVSAAKQPAEKAAILRGGRPTDITIVSQAEQLKNPDARINFAGFATMPLLSRVAHSSHGIGTFDSPRFCRNWWEVGHDADTWVFQQSTPDSTSAFSGCCFALRWEHGQGSLASLMADKRANGYTSGKSRAGVSESGKRGILAGQMKSHVRSMLERLSMKMRPNQPERDIGRHSCSAQASIFPQPRAMDDSIKVTCKTLVKVPFDLAIGKSRGGEVSQRLARAGERRSDAVALPRPAGGIDRATPGGGGTAAGLSLAGGTGRPSP